jgi:gliding motility-associated-like protein
MKKFTLILLSLFIVNSINAQCTAPNFNVDLSAAPDTTWMLSGTSRGGLCCGSSNCVRFNVTIHANTGLISFKVSNPSPSGSAFYQVNCGPPISIGTAFCVSGLASPFTITYCKPGGDRPDYTIIAGSVGHASEDITIRNTGCTDTLFVSNILTSSILWTSIYPGAPGAYNSFLSCTSGCTSTLVSASGTPPPYVDFQVSGAPNTLSCGTTCKDTVRVYFVNDMAVTISPPSPVTCSSAGTAVTMTANPTGGLAPYTYSWSTGSTNQAITTSTTGTYTVTVSDGTQCPSVALTKTLGVSPVATFTYTAVGYCKNNPSNPFPTFTGTGQAGTFTATPAGLVFVNVNTGEINLAASAPNSYTVTNTVPAAGPCPGTSATATVYVLPVPVMTSASSASLCTGGTFSIPLTANFSSTFSWVAANNPNVTGESLTPQTSTTLSNTLVNTTGTPQIVTYTVIPTATIYGNCTGTSQTVNVTVNPKDDAGFYYSSSTVCKTGSNPTPIITGLTSGSFSAPPGVAISVANGTVNLSGTSVGSYMITYSVYNACPNSATFPITVTAGPSATFSYSSSSYCQSAGNQLPIFPAGSSAGTFSSNAGLIFASTVSGEINPAASTPGTYVVTNTIPASGGCAATSASVTVTITKYYPATFSYIGTPYCQNGANPLPAFSGGSIAGVFSAPAGLSINSATGEVNLGASVPGTYLVTNSIAASGGCPSASATASITITPLPVSTFSYTGTPYCQNATNPLPTFSGGGVAGTFTSSSLFLSVSSSDGAIDLAGSSSDNYIITNTIPASNGCPAVSTSVPVTITQLPIATFNYVESPYCQDAADPTPILDPNGTNGIFTGSSSGLSIEPNSGTLDLSASAGGTYTVTNTIPAYGGCPVVVATGSITITAPTPGTFSYAGSPYCKDGNNPLPSFIGGGVAGIFSAPSGLVINSATGEVNLAASNAGTYTVTNTTPPANGCPGAAYTATITITAMPIATFSYTDSPYCQNGSDPSAIFSAGATAGIFSSTAGLNMNASTGLVNLAVSTAGSYTVTNTIAAANGCPAVTATSDITITPLPAATFSYTASPYCQNGINPSPTFSGGGVAGIFSSTAGLNMNASTGSVNLAASTPGTYTVTNTIPAANGCPAVTATSDITITPLPIATFNYTASPYCQNGINPSATFSTGATAGMFSSTAGLSINASTGSVNLAASTTGSYTVTNTIAAADGCPAVSETANITITPLPVATFNYTSSPYCNNGSDPSATLSAGATAGTFSSTSGLSINALNGLVDLSASTAGTYSITNTIAASDGCPSVTATANITITSLPVATFSYTSPSYCQDENNVLPIFINSATAGVFSAPTGLNIHSATGEIDFSASLTGSYIITNTIAAANGCEEVTEICSLSIDPIATANAGADATICSGNSYTLFGIISGGASSLSWTSSGSGVFDDNTSATATYTPSAADILAGNVILTITSNEPFGPCSFASDAMTLIIEPAAIADASADAVICSGSGYTLTGSIGGGASSLTWTSSGTGTFDNNLSANATYIPSPADIISGGLFLTLTSNDPSGTCEAATDAMILSIDPIPVADAGDDTAICAGSSYSLSGIISGGASSLLWTSSGSGSFDDNTSASAIYIPSAADISTGNVILTISTDDPAGPCSSVSDDIVLTINPMPLADAGQDMPVCEGDQFTLNGTIGGGASSAIWTSNGSGTLNDSSSLSAIYSPSTADLTNGSVLFTLSTNDPEGACSSVNDTVLLTINPAATINAGTDAAICEGIEYAVSGNVGGGANSLIWTSNGSGSFDNATSLNAVYTPSASDVLAGNVVLTIGSNDPSGPCPSVTDEMILTITPRDNPSFAYNNSIFCVTGTNPVPIITGLAGGTFNAITASLVLNPSTGIIDLSGSQTGSYTISYTTAGACPDSSSVNVSITDGLVAAFNYGTGVYCSNASDQLPVLGLNSSGGIFTSSPGLAIDSVSGQVNLSASIPGTYTVTNTVASSGGCAEAVSTNTITIIQQDNASFSYSASAFCHSAEDQLPVISGTPGGVFSCVMSGLVMDTSGEINVSSCMPGTYPVTYMTNGVCYDSETISITINSLPVVEAGNERLIDCGANPIDIEVVDSSGNVISYTWNTNGGNIISGNGTNAASVNQTGLYYVVATNTFGCVTCDTVIVNESPIVPEASFTSSSAELTGIVPFVLNFDNTSQNANTYNWNFGDGSGGTSISDPGYTFNTAGTYIVTLIASNNGRCADTARITIEVEDEFFIPDGFSPNGDGINDVFVIRGINRYRGNKLVVFNRWGNQVHAASPYENQWNGSTTQNMQMGGNELPVGTYFYVLDLGDGSKPFKGYIYLNK